MDPLWVLDLWFVIRYCVSEHGLYKSMMWMRPNCLPSLIILYVMYVESMKYHFQEYILYLNKCTHGSHQFHLRKKTYIGRGIGLRRTSFSRVFMESPPIFLFQIDLLHVRKLTQPVTYRLPIWCQELSEVDKEEGKKYGREAKTVQVTSETMSSPAPWCCTWHWYCLSALLWSSINKYIAFERASN